MNIGLVSHINPAELRAFLHEGQNVPDTGVSASSVHALATGLLRQGHRLTVFAPVSHSHIGLKTAVLEGERLKIIMVPVISRIDFLFRDRYLPQLLHRQIRRELDHLDVLHAQWTYENAAACVPFAERIPTFCSVRDWWPVQWEYMKAGANPVLRWSWGHAMKRMFRRTMGQSAIHFIANSEYTRDKILESYPEYGVSLIPNPLNSSFILPDKPFAFNGVFISIAPDLFDPRKNLDPLVQAFHDYRQQAPASRLILVGKYDKGHPEYRRWERSGWLEGVELCGYLSHDQVIAKLDEASVLIHPSLEETYGNILLEAMSRRLLALGGSRSGAVPSVLGEGKWGALCDVSSPGAILSAMKDIAADPAGAAAKVDAATAHLKADLSEEAIAGRHIELYKKYLA